MLPVSNLTNLLAFTMSGLGFARFAVAMTPVWSTVLGTEYLLLRAKFGAELTEVASGPPRRLLSLDPPKGRFNHSGFTSLRHRRFHAMRPWFRFVSASLVGFCHGVDE